MNNLFPSGKRTDFQIGDTPDSNSDRSGECTISRIHSSRYLGNFVRSSCRAPEV